MILWSALLLLQVAAPWIAAATVAGVLAWALADRESRDSCVSLAVVAVFLGALASALLPGLRAGQIDRLRFEEASTYCSSEPVRVLKRLAEAEQVKFGVYDSYLGPGEYKSLDFALRSRQTQPSSNLQKIVLVQLKRGEQPPDDVYPVLRRVASDSIGLTVIEPRTGEIVAYSNYINGQEGETRSQYVGCDREVQGTPKRLEDDQLFSLLAAIVSPPGASGAPASDSGAARKRSYDIERAAMHDVREDCSKGLTRAPGLQYSLDYRYLRSGDDLVVVVLDRAAWDQALSKKNELQMINQAPILWQHFYPAVTCKSYFSDDNKAGPVFHAQGYEEPVSRVRALGKETYYPFDYGPHRKVRCNETIVTGTVRPAWHYALKREGNDLGITAIEDLHGAPTKFTPLITCEGYFNSASGPAPDVMLGAGGSTREIHHSAARILQLGDGQYLGPNSNIMIIRPTPPAAQPIAAPRPAPSPGTAPSREREPAPASASPWPAKPRING